MVTSSCPMVAGVLALQGCVDQHVNHLTSLGVTVRRVRLPSDLEGLDRILLPGGESSTMLSLLKRSGLFEKLREFVAKKPAWGVCAGAILLADEVVHPNQESLHSIPVRATRNFYGCQLESFKTKIKVKSFKDPIEVDFIRAPKLEALHSSVEVLATHENNPVLLKKGKILVSAFHTELTDSSSLHRFFLDL